MTTRLIAATAALALMGLSARAESDGNPFPYAAPGLVVAAGAPRARDVGAAAFPDLVGGPGWVFMADAKADVPSTGSEGTVQTAGSLPVGFMAGMVAQAAMPVPVPFSAQPVRLDAAWERKAPAKLRRG